MTGRATLITAVTSFVAGLACAPLLHLASGPAVADEKKSPEAFLSGGARSEKVLVEILTTLKEVKTDTGSIEEILKTGRAGTNGPSDSRGKSNPR